MEKIKLGISTCLTGQKVRYDGGHKRDSYLMDILGKFVEYVPVCPEVECGMSIPREAVRLVGDPDAPRLVTRSGERDYTETMQHWGEERVKKLKEEKLCGFIFQKSSPSSGMERIKVYNESGMGVKKGVGIFARQFMDHFPRLPVEDDGRLHDAALRENFIMKIYIQDRWYKLLENRSHKALVEFHTDHKLIIMGCSPGRMYELGAIVAEGKKGDLDERLAQYHDLLFDILNEGTSVKKNRNVLDHIQGYFKKILTTDEKQELKELIVEYYNHHLPLIVPVTMINHYVRKYGVEYLERQYYLKPHPGELALRNHV
jgi:uncharacterized protein YbgA (DUF1722 family)/uncharacterized protein YbbK (DUF523 family)